MTMYVNLDSLVIESCVRTMSKAKEKALSFRKSEMSFKASR